MFLSAHKLVDRDQLAVRSFSFMKNAISCDRPHPDYHQEDATMLFVVTFGALLLIGGGLLYLVRLLPAITVILLLVVINILYHRYVAAPTCGSDDVTFAVTSKISKLFPGGVDIKDIRTLSGGVFSVQNDCEMAVRPISNVNRREFFWTIIDYSTRRPEGNKNTNIEVQIVSPAVLASSNVTTK